MSVPKLNLSQLASSHDDITETKSSPVTPTSSRSPPCSPRITELRRDKPVEAPEIFKQRRHSTGTKRLSPQLSRTKSERTMPSRGEKIEIETAIDKQNTNITTSPDVTNDKNRNK